MKVNKQRYAGLLVKNLLLGTLAIVVSISPAVLSEALADPLDKSSPKIAHGIYRDRGKSSPKIGHSIYRDRGKSSPKIAHGMYRDRGKSSPKIAHGMYKEIDKSSPKIAHGMYRDRGKSSPKIAHGMYKDRGKSSPKIAERTLQSQRNLLHEEIQMAIEMGRLQMADDLLHELDKLVWEGGGGFGMRRSR